MAKTSPFIRPDPSSPAHRVARGLLCLLVSCASLHLAASHAPAQTMEDVLGPPDYRHLQMIPKRGRPYIFVLDAFDDLQTYFSEIYRKPDSLATSLEHFNTFRKKLSDTCQIIRHFPEDKKLSGEGLQVALTLFNVEKILTENTPASAEFAAWSDEQKQRFLRDLREQVVSRTPEFVFGTVRESNVTFGVFHGGDYEANLRIFLGAIDPFNRLDQFPLERRPGWAVAQALGDIVMTARMMVRLQNLPTSTNPESTLRRLRVSLWQIADLRRRTAFLVGMERLVLPAQTKESFARVDAAFGPFQFDPTETKVDDPFLQNIPPATLVSLADSLSRLSLQNPPAEPSPPRAAAESHSGSTN